MALSVLTHGMKIDAPTRILLQSIFKLTPSGLMPSIHIGFNTVGNFRLLLIVITQVHIHGDHISGR